LFANLVRARRPPAAVSFGRELRGRFGDDPAKPQQGG
jgi:hypothetical protein